mmetsp:Transcript_757/g.2259  ORF Transcript_757/g.2259 Transcript_757/m.2259 type:complete len:203 (+) Transcript_757:339-947(+)
MRVTACTSTRSGSVTIVPCTGCAISFCATPAGVDPVSELLGLVNCATECNGQGIRRDVFGEGLIVLDHLDACAHARRQQWQSQGRNTPNEGIGSADDDFAYPAWVAVKPHGQTPANVTRSEIPSPHYARTLQVEENADTAALDGGLLGEDIHHIRGHAVVLEHGAVTRVHACGIEEQDRPADVVGGGQDEVYASGKRDFVAP